MKLIVVSEVCLFAGGPTEYFIFDLLAVRLYFDLWHVNQWPSCFVQDEQTIEPLTYGRISSYYYLKHQTIRMFKERLKPELPVQELLAILSVSKHSFWKDPLFLLIFWSLMRSGTVHFKHQCITTFTGQHPDTVNDYSMSPVWIQLSTHTHTHT